MAYNKDLIVLSASAFTTLKMCPWKYRNQYHYGIRTIQQADPLRIGTLYHEGQELLLRNPESVCRRCAQLNNPIDNCFICQGTGFLDDPLKAINRMLDFYYGTKYKFMDVAAMKRERAIILYGLFAYHNVYKDQPYEIIAEEIPFRIPLIDPVTRKPIENIVIDGKIDKLVRSTVTIEGGSARPGVAIMEHKSTASKVDAGSDYWNSLRLDTQTTLYVYAVQRMQVEGLLVPYGIKPTDTPICDIVYDVWRKPSIKPKALSADDTLDFLVNEKYMGRSFEVSCEMDEDDVVTSVTVDGEDVPVTCTKCKKKKPVISETEDMFGCRVFNTMIESPSEWLNRKPLTRSTDDIAKFEYELYSMAMNVKFMKENDAWYHNEKACEARAKCEYCHLCYSGTQVDSEHVPTGFRNIFEGKKNGSTGNARRGKTEKETGAEAETETAAEE